jgi:hypothetical protein
MLASADATAGALLCRLFDVGVMTLTAASNVTSTCRGPHAVVLWWVTAASSAPL